MSENQGRKQHYSNFLLTVNSNFRPSSREEALEMRDRLRTGMKALCTEQGMRSSIKFLNGGNYYDNILEPIDVEFAAELGEDPKGSRIHVHALMKLVHNDKVQLNREAIKSVVGSASGIPSLYVNAKWVPSERTVQDYIKKQQAQPQPQPATPTSQSQSQGEPSVDDTVYQT